MSDSHERQRLQNAVIDKAKAWYFSGAGFGTKQSLCIAVGELLEFEKSQGLLDTSLSTAYPHPDDPEPIAPWEDDECAGHGSFALCDETVGWYCEKHAKERNRYLDERQYGRPINERPEKI